MTPGAEDSSRQVVKRLCDQFAVSEAARQVDMTVQFEMRVRSACEARQDATWLYNQQTPFLLSPETVSSLKLCGFSSEFSQARDCQERGRNNI
jgi:hypothetical protein